MSVLKYVRAPQSTAQYYMCIYSIKHSKCVLYVITYRYVSSILHASSACCFDYTGHSEHPPTLKTVCYYLGFRLHLIDNAFIEHGKRNLLEIITPDF